MENQIDNPLLIALVLPSSPQKMSAALESTDFIASKIHFWKGEKVLFDSDLAVLSLLFVVYFFGTIIS